MSFVAVGVGGAALVGGVAGAVISSNAASSAADKQTQAAEYASDLQNSQFQQQQTNQAPYRQAGYQALSQMGQMTQSAPQFTQQDFLNNQDPAYQFDMQQGLDAIQRSAAARGGLQSGGTLKSLNDYAQGQASNEYQNAYSRFMNNQNTQFNRLASIAGTGQTANAQIGQAGQNMANQVGNNMMGAANAQGAAGVAGANAWSGALSGAGQAGMNGLLISRMPNYGSPGGSLSSLGSASPAYDASQMPVQPYQSTQPFSLLGE